jgi:hypothetical protein
MIHGFLIGLLVANILMASMNWNARTTAGQVARLISVVTIFGIVGALIGGVIS